METLSLPVKTYGIGTKAYLDTPFAGLIPCIVVGIAGESFGHVAVNTLSLTIKLTASRGAYRRGETIQASAYDCPPRDRVTRRRYTRTVCTRYRYFS